MLSSIRSFFRKVRFCRSPAGLPPGTIVVFPVSRHRLTCGLAGILEVVREVSAPTPDLAEAERTVRDLPSRGLVGLSQGVTGYAGGEAGLGVLERLVDGLRHPGCFPALYRDAALRERISEIASRIEDFVAKEGEILDRGESLPPLTVQEEVNRRIVRLRDASWAMEREVLTNVERVRDLVGDGEHGDKLLREFRKLNLILNTIDRLEIRGRDSAGILVQVRMPEPGALSAVLERHPEEVRSRTGLQDLPDGAVSLSGDGRTATFVYKVAAEVGNLGDNVATLRRHVAGDDLVRALLSLENSQVLVMAHTRWASNGIINIANCHPLDSDCVGESRPLELSGGLAQGDLVPRVHVALNGDIDNYQELRRRFEKETGRRCSERITTDAKVIALWIDHHLRRGEDLETAFRRAVGDFDGSAAILMVSDLEPGRMYLSLKGSGQSLYVGLAPESFVVASEIYGLVEETPEFLKLEGERPRVEDDPASIGQIFILDPEERGLPGIRAAHHDGAALDLADVDVRHAEITTRDVDRGEHAHFFLKEISQAPGSVAKTLRGKFSLDGHCLMGPETVPEELVAALVTGGLDAILVVGQGTAAVAAMAVGEFLKDSLRGTRIRVESMKASELSGFRLREEMSRTLVIAVTQSGATADTNRAVDLARERGAITLAIVNRRNSDITFKTAGVIYTSDGRDVEMSVASTKAFYSQVVAGAVLGLALGAISGSLSRDEIIAELTDLRRLPRLLEEVFSRRGEIERVAALHAPSRRYWSVVGSGPNRIAAEEVRIKLSELCYKSISADSVEDKKHIDLSSEAMLLVLAAGHEDAVLSDLAKDVAIFKAHRALPVVFASEGESRFDDYAAEVVELPPASPLLSMVTCTMAGHLFGYHAARAIDEGGRFLGQVRAVVVEALDRPDTAALRELSRFGRQYHERLRAFRFASALESNTASDLTLLLKYAAGDLPPTTFEAEFGREPRPAEIHAVLLERLVEAVDQTLRPIDAIKHQAKIVTVGTSRIAEVPTGVIFDSLKDAGVKIASISFADRMRLREVQPAVRTVEGLTLYAIEEPPLGGVRTIRVTDRVGAASSIPSRAEGGAPLKGTKRAVVTARQTFVGVGAKDGRRIAIIPLVDSRFAITSLALLHLEFQQQMSPAEKREILGNRYDDIVNWVTEADIQWSDELLAGVTPNELLTQAPARIAEKIVGFVM